MRFVVVSCAAIAAIAAVALLRDPRPKPWNKQKLPQETAFPKGKRERPVPCDTLAAHPMDNQRVVQDGVPDDELLEASVSACTEDVRSRPTVMRLHFQLGRGLAKFGKDLDAVKSFQTAWKGGHCAAGAHLADAYRDGVFDGSAEAEHDDWDPEEIAKKLYADSSACGFMPAAEVLETAFFRKEDYQASGVMEALYDGDVLELNVHRPFVAVYARGIHDYLGMEFHPVSNDCPALVNAKITRSLDAAMYGDPPNAIWRKAFEYLLIPLLKFSMHFVDPVWPGDIDKYKEYLLDIGKKDGVRLAVKHGCKPGSITQQVYEGVLAFADAEQPLLETYEQGGFEELGEEFHRGIRKLVGTESSMEGTP